MRDVRDVEETDAAHPVLAHGILHALRAAIEASAEVLAGDEEQVAVDRHVVLGVGTHIKRDERGVARLRDVPHLEAVEVALHGVMAREGNIRIEEGEVAGISIVRELRRLGRRGHRSEEHTSELQSLAYLVCRLLLEKKK